MHSRRPENEVLALGVVHLADGIAEAPRGVDDALGLDGEGLQTCGGTAEAVRRWRRMEWRFPSISHSVQANDDWHVGQGLSDTVVANHIVITHRHQSPNACITPIARSITPLTLPVLTSFTSTPAALPASSFRIEVTST